MNRNNILIVMIVISSFWSACGAGVGDTSEDLGNGYTYRSEGSMRWINPGISIYEDGIDGNVVEYKFDKNYILAIQEPSEVFYKGYFRSMLTYKYSGLIYDPTSVKNVDIHQRKFVNSRWWQDSILRKKMASHITPDNNNDDAQVESIVDSVIKTDSYYKRIFSRKRNYWIIRKKDNELFGPFSKEDI